MLVEYIGILFRILFLILDGKELACEKLCGERGGRKLLRNCFFFFFFYFKLESFRYCESNKSIESNRKMYKWERIKSEFFSFPVANTRIRVITSAKGRGMKDGTRRGMENAIEERRRIRWIDEISMKREKGGRSSKRVAG